MAIKRLVLQVKAKGMLGAALKLATIELLQQPTEPELSEFTELVCPNDFKRTKYVPASYLCECGASFGHWSKLARVLKGTRKILEMAKLSKGNGEIESAELTCMGFQEFVKQGYADALPKEDAERPIKATDDESKKNLFKLLVANQIDKTAIIVKWNDTHEQKIALLTTSPSGKVVLRRIIPSNLVRVKDPGIYLDPTQITKEDVAEAQEFLKSYVPKATPETFDVDDYRVQAVTVEATAKATTAPAKQQAMAELLQVAKAKKKVSK